MGFFDIVNITGLIFTVVMLVPHIVFVKTHKDCSTKAIDNRGMVYIERIGKYCSVFLMSFNIGVLEKGFTSDLMHTYWLVSTSVLIVVYLALWVVYFRLQKKGIAYALTILAGVIIMQSGLLQVKTLLLTAGVIYLIGELYITKKLL